ncbi:MAG: acyltransferase [Pantoea sp.]|uniref:acyltransferase family protein n=1 Tax=Pantoea sp. TaxID=69393 RepID=UPI00290E06DC|nr:acyltransferase [Pantoea sp.]MDU5779661.1 acyltransferase [Pantoea sp.]
MVNKQTSYRGLQALRGIAALSVMLFHFRWNINAQIPGRGDELLGWGATGVDLFFLISGFVITLSAARSPQGIIGALTFLKKRALRILPAYYIILLISFFLTGAMSTFHYADKTGNLISALTFMPILPDHPPFYVDDSGMYGVRWTLNYEVMFYLFISVALLFAKRWIGVSALFAATLIVLPLTLGHQLTLQPAGYKVDSALAGLITNPMLWLFITGMCVGLLLPYLKWLSPKIMAVGAVCSLIAAAYFFSQGMFAGHGLLSSGWIYGLILLTFALSEDIIGKYVPECLIRLGDISFSLYLIHTLMNNGLGKRFASIGIEDGYVRFIVSIILSCLLAWLSWRYIERPFIRVGKNKPVIQENNAGSPSHAANHKQ